MLIKEGNTINNNKLINKAKEVLCLDCIIQVYDNKKVIVENCKHIIECDDIMVKLYASDKLITIWGKELSLNYYNKECIVVNGIIESVELQNRRGKNNEI